MTWQQETFWLVKERNVKLQILEWQGMFTEITFTQRKVGLVLKTQFFTLSPFQHRKIHRGNFIVSQSVTHSLITCSLELKWNCKKLWLDNCWYFDVNERNRNKDVTFLYPNEYGTWKRTFNFNLLNELYRVGCQRNGLLTRLYFMGHILLRVTCKYFTSGMIVYGA